MTRRARLRVETIREIKAIAMAQMAADGPGAISLRAIAREMGMTPRALYGYFSTRDDLITALISDLATTLADRVEAARDAVSADDPGGRVVAWGQALREWALANPDGFRLVYGDAIPGYRPPEGGPLKEASRRNCIGLTELVAAAWPQARALQPDEVVWSAFPDGFIEKIRADLPDVPPAAVALALRVWGRMQGLVALEVHGQLRQVTTDPAALHHAEMLDLVRSLGLAPPAR